MSNRVYLYARISKKTQNIERQIRNLKAEYPNGILVKEAYTGTRIQGRKEFELLCKKAEKGDTIVFDAVSRMSRNAAEGFLQYKDFFDKGVELRFLKEPHINTEVFKEALKKQIPSIKTGDEATDELMAGITDALNTYMMRLAERQIELAFAVSQAEVENLHQRTKEGIETARLHGKQIGNPKGAKLVIKKAAPAKQKILELCRDFGGPLNDKDCISCIKIARGTFYKYKSEIKIDLMKKIKALSKEFDGSLNDDECAEELDIPVHMIRYFSYNLRRMIRNEEWYDE